jgi:hypothetical protein
MPCEKYQAALIELAAADAETGGDLRAHLDGCISCRAALAAEQALFDAIDVGLHRSANAELPPSLLANVTARLAEGSAPQRGWLPVWALAAATAVMVVGIMGLQRGWRAKTEQASKDLAILESSPSADAPSGTEMGAKKLSTSSVRTTIRRTAVPAGVPLSETLTSATAVEPEVLVAPDQELLLAEYARALQNRPPVNRASANPEVSLIEPVQLGPIEIARLEVKPLPDLQPK